MHGSKVEKFTQLIWELRVAALFVWTEGDTSMRWWKRRVLSEVYDGVVRCRLFRLKVRKG